MGIALKLYIDSGSMDILIALILPIHEHGIAFPFSCVVLHFSMPYGFQSMTLHFIEAFREIYKTRKKCGFLPFYSILPQPDCLTLIP